MNIVAEPGQTVALLGPTGSGKSSVVNLLPRFYDPSDGRVLIDGQDVRDVTLDSLRRSIGIVQQDVFLFITSIRDNIRYGRPDATDEEVIAAITRPPEDTRAYFRGECLRRYGAAVFGVNWDSISFSVDDDQIKRFRMEEPLKGSRAHVAELLDRSPTAADLVKNLRA